MEYDFLVVGAGLSGCVIAERMASLGKTVLLIEQRSHVGGNVYDEDNGSGILIHKYGPHIFHTNSKEVFEYLSKFTKWYRYEHRVLSLVNNKYVPIPINRKTINILYNLNLKTEDQVAAYLEKVKVKMKSVNNAEEAVTSRIGVDLYEKLFKGYTKKQWGVDATKLDPEVTLRIPVRLNEDDRYFSDAYQALPDKGYTNMINNMLANKLITVMLNTDYKDVINNISYKYFIYTGPIDYFFDYKYGRLRYRSIKFRIKVYNEEWHQPTSVVNYPNESVMYTRSTEFKHFTSPKYNKQSKTVVQYEYPTGSGEPYYPMITNEDNLLYIKYKNDADKLYNTFFVGRLANFKYFNMDQVVAASLKLSKKLEIILNEKL